MPRTTSRRNREPVTPIQRRNRVLPISGSSQPPTRSGATQRARRGARIDPRVTHEHGNEPWTEKDTFHLCAMRLRNSPQPYRRIGHDLGRSGQACRLHKMNINRMFPGEGDNDAGLREFMIEYEKRRLSASSPPTTPTPSRIPRPHLTQVDTHSADENGAAQTLLDMGSENVSPRNTSRRMFPPIVEHDQDMLPQPSAEPPRRTVCEPRRNSYETYRALTRPALLVFEPAEFLDSGYDRGRLDSFSSISLFGTRLSF